MLNFIFGTVWGWIGTAGVVVIACLVVGYFIPQFRLYALAVIGIVVSAATIYTKGTRDRAALEQRRRDEAVKKLGGEYDEIEKRTDSDRARDRLRNDTF